MGELEERPPIGAILLLGSPDDPVLALHLGLRDSEAVQRRRNSSERAPRRSTRWSMAF